MKTIKEQKKEAKEYRKITPRSDLGLWEVKTGRPEVKEMLLRQEETRVPELIPERRKRMSVSPFTFFRGAAIIEAHDLSLYPGTEFFVQACGDAHIANFGIFGSPERRLVFDINDFDETLPAPFEVDVKRLLASVEILGRDRNFSKEKREEAAYHAAHLYRKTIRECSEMGNLEVWYSHLDVQNLIEKKGDKVDPVQLKHIQAMLDKAMAKNSDRAIEKLTETVDGKLRIKSAPPIIVPIRDMIHEERKLYDFQSGIHTALESYMESLSDARKYLIGQYEILELAHKVVGVGSVGRRAWILVMLGRKNGDPLVLQIKEAERSVLEEYYGKSAYSMCGRRVVEGQKAIQTAGDILLGWMQVKNPDGRMIDYYVRQLWDAKGSIDLTQISEEGYRGLSLLSAWTLAHAHAKTGNRHAIAGYLGKSDEFEQAMVRYAGSYADQNEADYQEFMKWSSDFTKPEAEG